jgi:hypothetical protein
MGPRNAYKDMLDNVVSPITCVSMNHQNQLEQMEYWGHVRYMCFLFTTFVALRNQDILQNINAMDTRRMTIMKG